MISESGIKSAVRRATADRVVVKLTDPNDRGAGRLMFMARPMANRVAGEWYAAYQRDGSRVSVKMGTYPSLSLAEARTRFRQDYAPAISAGADPHPGARSRKAKPATLRELFDGYVADLTARGKVGSAYKAGRQLDRAAKSLGAGRIAASVKPAELVDLLADIHATGRRAHASNARAFMHAAFEFGIASAHDYTRRREAVDYGLTVNPVAAIPADSDASRPLNRFLDEAEYRAFYMWLMEYRHRSRKAYGVALMMLTGQRGNEVFSMSAERYRDGVMSWPVTKNGMPHSVPLCRRARDLLAEMLTDEQGWYFERGIKRVDGIQTSNPGDVVRKYVDETGCAKFSSRDLRRTWKTLAGRAGLSAEIRDRYQNHQDDTRSKVARRHYDRHDQIEELRAAMLVWDGFLDRVLGGE